MLDNTYIFDFLALHQIEYICHEHEAIATVEQAQAIDHTMDCSHTKNLFLTDKRGQYYLVCMDAYRRFDMKRFLLSVGARDMSFGSADDMMELLGVTPGSVSLCGMIHYGIYTSSGGTKPLSLYIDQTIHDADRVGRHPNCNTATLVLRHQERNRMLDIIHIPYHILNS
jgi:Ala-tRNA(Pro) deacylase